ncbi:hypothetical protein BYT27DRAFT_6393896 [Phlegmacium glaucopus]|nr:hypothetical protein BYT27DRAFT_6393896 [Phlegmacium glaucopus]
MSKKSTSTIALDIPVTSTLSPDPKQLPTLGNQRLWWQRVPFTSSKLPKPPKESLEDASFLPEATAGFFSLITFSWITPLLSLGYARPLEATDLYKLQSERSAAYIADQITESFVCKGETLRLIFYLIFGSVFLLFYVSLAIDLSRTVNLNC